MNFTHMDLTDKHVLLEALIRLREAIEQDGEAIFKAWKPYIERRDFLISGKNLAHYLALRRYDLRPLQAALMPWGLSSLGRIEARVMPNLQAVIATLSEVCQLPEEKRMPHPRVNKFYRGERMLQRRTEEVFGKPHPERRVYIMVTMPTEAATDSKIIHDLMMRGMDCIRINCAHDTPREWQAMVEHMWEAEQETGLRCQVAVDLAGPKSRTADVLMPEGTRLKRGDSLLLTRETPQPNERYPHQVRCTLTDALDQVHVGSRVWMDDGKIGTEVIALLPDGALLRVTHARDKGERLANDKGVNFPDTDLRLNPLTDKDLQDLDFVVKYADIVNYSFVQEATDIDRLQRELAARTDRADEIAIVAKIETAAAVRNLPDLIVHSAGRQPFGVMIARGDLAVEIGYERLAEMQEEILWLCEAAHVPVIWATQVLETLAKKGRPSRAEMTDAAMSERAECVMLNKGPYVAEAITFLDDVLKRMQAHQLKKTAQLRALRSWQRN